MGDQEKGTSASGVISQSLQAVKQSFQRLVTELREQGQKGNNWPLIQPVLDKVDGATANFFSKPEASGIGEVKRSIAQHFTDLRQVCERSNVAPAILPFAAGAESMMNVFLQQYQQAH